MKVIAFDPFLSDTRAVEIGVEKTLLEDLFRRADIITLHTPLTDDTRSIINAAAIAKMKKGVRIVNCARGGLVVEEDLKAAIESGHVAGAAFDVFSEEPAKSNVLFGLDAVVCTPHLGAATIEAQDNVALQVAEQMADFLLQGAVVNALNMPSVSAEDAPKLKPYMTLAEQLGSFAGQLALADVSEIEITYEGSVAALNVTPLSALALAGFLKPVMDGVNVVSAPLRASERGITVAETRRDTAKDYQTLIRITVTGAAGVRKVEGTLFGGRHPRIVSIDGVAVEAALGAHMLFIQNRDEPGLIGAVGTLLGNNKINIADFSLGRVTGKNAALALVTLDAKADEKIIAALEKLPQVERVRALTF